jgi:predicted PurR-regulated permease PerM
MAQNAKPVPTSLFPRSDFEAADAVASAPHLDRSSTTGQSAVANSVIEETEILHASLKAGSIAQIVVAIIAVLGLLYLLKFVMVTILLALLLAFVLEPFVHQLSRIFIPRAAGALIAVVLAVGLAGGISYLFVGRLGDFATELPKYSERIQRTLSHIQEPMRKLEKSTRPIAASATNSREPVPVEIQEEPTFSRIVAASSAAIGESCSLSALFPS